MKTNNDGTTMKPLSLRQAVEDIKSGLAGKDWETVKRGVEPIFLVIQDEADWKEPIDKHIDLSLYGIEHNDDTVHAIEEAVEFYTATEATIQDLGDSRVRITAAGYSAGPAA